MLTACKVPVATDTPITAWQTFRRAAEAGDSERAFGLLSPEDQAALDARALELSAAKGPKLPSWQFLQLDRQSLPAWRKLKVESTQGDKATLLLELDGGKEERVLAVRVADEWRVSLGLNQ